VPVRLFLDTNVLISAIIFPNSQTAAFLARAIERHTVVISSYVIDELHDVFLRKFNSHVSALETFLSEFSYELVYTPRRIEKSGLPEIRDPDDLPIIVSAMVSDCDYLITGDKDILEIELERPIILSPNQFEAVDCDQFEDTE
jgi:putative PIN family toxin of toxin-antitoxin system